MYGTRSTKRGGPEACRTRIESGRPELRRSAGSSAALSLRRRLTPDRNASRRRGSIVGRAGNIAATTVGSLYLNVSVAPKRDAPPLPTASFKSSLELPFLRSIFALSVFFPPSLLFFCVSFFYYSLARFLLIFLPSSLSAAFITGFIPSVLDSSLSGDVAIFRSSIST